MAEPEPALVWTRERPQPSRRAPSVEQIVARAIAIADADGLAAVTMRRVAAELRSGTASLYRYLTNRDELLEKLEEHQKDLEQEVADVADLIRRLRDESRAAAETAGASASV